MKIYELPELVNLARTYSPYYRKLYAQVPLNFSLTDLPPINMPEFWKANTLTDNQLLTGPLSQGMAFKSGGTTGQPKFSLFYPEEWKAFITTFGKGLAKSVIQEGDRVANLFYAGDLYASFLFIMGSLENSGVPLLQLPLSGSAPWESTAKTIQEFQVNVLAGVPTTLCNLAQKFAEAGYLFPQVEKILYGGETLYEDQIPLLQSVFPRVKVLSIGYASVDAGLLGYRDQDCEPWEHKPFRPETLFEIVDPDSGEPIQAMGVPGKVLITNLTRSLMPIIRYPAGDLACWTSPGKFRILGRAEEGARVGPMTLYLDDLRQIVTSQLDSGLSSNMQVVVRHRDTRDQLVLRIARGHQKADWEALTEQLISTLYQERPMYQELLGQGMIDPCVVEWIDAQDLRINPRTGKTLRLIDERLN